MNRRFRQETTGTSQISSSSRSSEQPDNQQQQPIFIKNNSNNNVELNNELELSSNQDSLEHKTLGPVNPLLSSDSLSTSSSSSSLNSNNNFSIREY